MRLKSVLRYVEERLFLYSWKATVLSADAFACCLFIGATSLAGHFKHNIEIILLVETTSRFPMWFPFIWNYLPPPPPRLYCHIPKASNFRRDGLGSSSASHAALLCPEVV